MKIKSMFDIIQGHQITDEEIYNTEGNIPVLTGQNQIKGYWNKQIVNEEDLPCITYPTKANPGVAYVQNKIFDANNTAVLIPFPEWRKKINLEWFSYKISNIFLKIQTSKGGVSYLNKEIVEEYDIEIPDTYIQIKELNYYKKLHNLKSRLEKIKFKINKVKQQNIIFDNQPSKEIILSEILDYISRNDSLSEEGLYKRSQDIKKAEKLVIVVSGSINGFYGYIPFDNTIHLVKDRPCLQVVTRGKAGQLKFLPKNNYATNTNAMLLVIKEEEKEILDIFNLEQEETYLKFLEIYLRPYFSEYCSNADLSVFPLTDAINEITIPFLKYSHKIIDIVNKFKAIDRYDIKVNKLLDKINLLLNKEIINEKSKKLS